LEKKEMSVGRIIRLFPRRTKATPVDGDVVVDRQPGFFDSADEIHISVAFTWDIPKAEYLAKQWESTAPVKLGGPALGSSGGDFVPGQYLKKGYVITSRGCPNKCWFCSVWRREGTIVRELPIMDGWNVLDDNLLACSETHIRNVFAMLKKQKFPVEFTGGLEAARLKDWHVDLLADLKPKQMFFAYDTPDDYEPLVEAGEKLKKTALAGGHRLRAYVLIGYPKDTFDLAEKRLKQTWAAGFLPMAMLWRNQDGKTNVNWKRFQRMWARPCITACLCKEGAMV
jgi:hypothetical protein